ncbi:unnamed protein product [Prorocentrum cordatum]|uniref:PNPLA domain-containing protein n=1 Tax=Prorocentrum cordatum TaxID=2364126 RepID=A0ABN9R8U4_9DINO|nr:unnamed protein product [Polarella glacialis]
MERMRCSRGRVVAKRSHRIHMLMRRRRRAAIRSHVGSSGLRASSRCARGYRTLDPSAPAYTHLLTTASVYSMMRALSPWPLALWPLRTSQGLATTASGVTSLAAGSETPSPLQRFTYLGCGAVLPQWSCKRDSETYYVDCTWTLTGSADSQAEQCAGRCSDLQGYVAFSVQDATSCLCLKTLPEPADVSTRASSCTSSSLVYTLGQATDATDTQETVASENDTRGVVARGHSRDEPAAEGGATKDTELPELAPLAPEQSAALAPEQRAERDRTRPVGHGAEAKATEAEEAPRRWVDDGCRSEDRLPADFLGAYVPEARAAAFARCCAGDGASCTSPQRCNREAPGTYAAAAATCRDLGLRLCTSHELLSDVCCGTGGDCDNYPAWTSSAAPGNDTMEGATKDNNGSQKATGKTTLPKAEPTFHLPPADLLAGPKIFVAWLISGQVPRFIYKDSAKYIDGGLQAWSGCAQTANHDCPVLVDVHIALSRTHAKHFFGPNYRMPYEEWTWDNNTGVGGHGPNESILEGHFKMLGANMVRATIIEEEQFNTTITKVREDVVAKAKAESGMEPEAFDKFWGDIQRMGTMRFIDNGNMMYMRHLAYKSAAEAEEGLGYKYTHVLYTREDNVFVHPSYTLLQLARGLDNGAEPSQAPASMLVDVHCGFKAWSDKMYFGNRRGIDILFAGTRDGHISLLASWINQAPTARIHNDPLKTEEWFERRLKEARANVSTFDFLRTEARYVSIGKEPCTTRMYRKCSSVGETFRECLMRNA